MRHPFVMGNWKLNGTVQLVTDLIAELRQVLHGVNSCAIAIAPPTIYLHVAQQKLAGSTISLGAQNVDINLSGAFTGEISATMLHDIGARYVIIGHSERRAYHHESDALIAKKFSILKKTGLIPVLCIGESEVENTAGQTETICAKQLDAVLNAPELGVTAFENAVIAYEPIWAIGTGKSATPAQAQAVHKFIRDYIAKKDATVAAKVIIQYGGSVNPHNATELFAQPDIDGALVGGASLHAEAFATIVHAATKAKYR